MKPKKSGFRLLCIRHNPATWKKHLATVYPTKPFTAIYLFARSEMPTPINCAHAMTCTGPFQGSHTYCKQLYVLAKLVSVELAFAEHDYVGVDLEMGMAQSALTAQPAGIEKEAWTQGKYIFSYIFIVLLNRITVNML